VEYIYIYIYIWRFEIVDHYLTQSKIYIYIGGTHAREFHQCVLSHVRFVQLGCAKIIFLSLNMYVDSACIVPLIQNSCIYSFSYFIYVDSTYIVPLIQNFCICSFSYFVYVDFTCIVLLIQNSYFYFLSLSLKFHL
jgi:hypothetical protein